MESTRLSTYLPAIISIGVLLLAAFVRWPYSFYIFLRIVVCLIAIYSAVKAKELGRTTWIWVMAGVAIVFNPVLPLRMHRPDWKIFNLIGAAIFAVWIVVAYLENSKRMKTKT